MDSHQRLLDILSLAEESASSGNPGLGLQYFEQAMHMIGQTGDDIDQISIRVWKIINALLEPPQPEIIRSLIDSLRLAGSKDLLGDFLLTIGGRLGNQTKNYAYALELHQMALELYEDIGDQMSILRALSNIVFCLNELEEYSQAYSICQRGLQLSQELESVSYLVKFIESHARILLRTGRIIEASQFLQTAQKDAGDNGFAAIAANLGVLAAEVKADAGDFDEAAALCFSALEDIRLLDSKPQEAELCTRAGALLMRIEDWEGADNLLRRAVELSEFLPVQDQANNHHNFAIVRSNLGSWADAAKLEETALRLYKEINYSMGLHLSETHLEQYRLKAGMEASEGEIPHSQMLDLLGNQDIAPPISSQEEQEHDATWLNFLKENNWIQDEPGGTESKIEISIPSPGEIRQETQDRLNALVQTAAQYPFNYDGLVNIQGAVGLMLGNQTQLRAAAGILEDQRASGWTGKSFRRVHLSLLILGHIYMLLDQPDQTAKVLSTAAIQCQENGQLWSEIALRRALSQAYQKKEAYETAFLEYQQITDLLRQAQKDIAWDDRSRRLFLDANFGFLEEMVEAAYQADEPQGALLLLENHRGQAFVESLRAKRIQETTSPETLREMEHLKDKRDELQDQMINCRIADTAGKDRIRKQLQENRREMEMLILQILSSDEKLISWGDLEENEILSIIPDDSQLIYYFVATEAFYILIHNGTAWHFIKRDIGRDALEEIICDCRKLWENHSRARGLGALPASSPEVRIGPVKELSELLLEGVLDPYGSSKEISIIPQDVICLVPFEALERSMTDAYLSDLYEVTYNPSLSELKNPLSGNDAQTDAFVAGVSTFSPIEFSDIQFNDLPNVKTEIEQISRTLGVEAFLNEDCQKDLLLENIKSARIVHLATHGYSDPEDPLLSSLIMSDGTYLKASDLTNIPLAADCVTLSACQTAVGLLSRGEGILGLAQAFLAAGAQAVIASLWQVDDQSTAVLFNHFYEFLKKGSSKSEALRLAKDHVRRYACRDEAGKIIHPFSDPYFWAAFILIGNQ